MSLVSIIIPTFNRADFIIQALESALAQTYAPIEIIVVDNGSTDNTLDLLRPYQDKITVCHEEKSGMGGSYARNKGIEVATGEFIAFLDSDDLWLPTKTEKQVAHLKQNPQWGWCYTDMVAFDSQTNKTLYQYSHRRQQHTGKVLRQTFVHIFTPLSTLLIRRDVIKQAGIFWPVAKGTDTDFIIRLAAASEVGVVPEILVRYRVHKNSVTGRINGQLAYEAGEKIVERAIKNHPNQLSDLRNSSLSKIATAVGLKLLQDQDQQLARKMFLKAIQLTPTNLRLYTYFLSTFAGSAIRTQGKKIRHWLQARKADGSSQA